MTSMHNPLEQRMAEADNTITPEGLDAHWMAYSGNRQFKQDPRVIVGAEGIYFIDDAAQSMNAKIGHRYAGTHGDVGVFSLDKGKNITTLQGGIIVTDDDRLAQAIDDEISGFPQPGIVQALSSGVETDLAPISEIPPASRVMHWIGWSIPVVIVGLLGLDFCVGSRLCGSGWVPLLLNAFRHRRRHNAPQRRRRP